MKSSQLGKMALIYSRVPSTWKSCESIVPNIHESYKLAFPKNKMEVFSLEEEMTPVEVFHLAHQIHANQPNSIVFMDHKPHPIFLIQHLIKLYKNETFPKLYFHVFGDFTLFLHQWKKLNRLLKKINTIIIAASDSQVNLIKSMISGSDNSVVKKIPFPVDEKLYYVDQKLRKKWRNHFEIKNGEHVFCYTGRISMQKNTIPLIKRFLSFSAKCEVPTKLILAGHFDDIASPFFGVYSPPGHYESKFRQMMKDVPEKLANRVVFLGGLRPQELLGVYNASDTFLSLSLHHDEDFGMSPIEAMSCGCPCVLTTWGGYNSFGVTNQDFPNAVKYVDVSIENKGLVVNYPDFAKHLKFSVDNKLTAKDRLSLSQVASTYFSTKACSKMVRSVLSSSTQVFPGFNWRFEVFQEKNPNGQPFPDGPVKNSVYEEIYSAYTGI